MNQKITVKDMNAPLTKSNPRNLAAQRLIDIAGEREDLYYVCSDRMDRGGLQVQFREKYPSRIVDLGIAEANCVGVASGIALCGNFVFVQTLGPFLATRDVDQINIDAGYNDLPVRFMATHSGLSSGGGPTHYTVSDYAIMSVLPNITMESPSDGNQFVKLVNASMNYPHPIYIRFPYQEMIDIYENSDYEYEIGKAVATKEGTQATVIACGCTLYEALKAAQELEKEGISVRVLDMHTISPLDTEAVLRAAKETGIVVTTEEASVVGGLGAAVGSCILESGIPCKFKRLGIPDEVAKYGSAAELFAYYGFDSEGIKEQIRKML